MCIHWSRIVYNVCPFDCNIIEGYVFILGRGVL